MARVLIYQQKSKLKPAGGSLAVGYYYSIEQDRRGEDVFDFLPDFKSFQTIHGNELKHVNKMPKWIQLLYRFVKQVIKYNIMLSGRYKLDPIVFSDYDIIHFHDTQNLYLRRFDLEKYKGKIILQSHSPQPFAQELLDSLSPWVRFFIPFARGRFEKMDRFAFMKADFIIFPCPEAEEPYYNNWKYYASIHEVKKDSYRYVLTGIPSPSPKYSRAEIRSSLNIIDNDFVVCYVGRHNVIKGYDSLKRIGARFLAAYQNAWFVCAGTEFPLTRLNHPHWIEIGWSKDAHSYIAASDVFVLPNKETYFDIVMLEILSLGKVVVASRTGGNKFFERRGCEGVFLYNTEEEAIKILEDLKKMSKEKLSSLGLKNMYFYQKYHTVACMYDNYIQTLNNLLSS